MKNENWDIIAKYLAKEEMNEEELENLESLKNDLEFKKIMSQSEDVFNKIELFYNQKQFDTNKAWAKVNPQHYKTKQRFELSSLLKIAAVLILLIATGITVWQFNLKNNKLNVYTTASTDLSKPEIELPDGTKVILNHGSKISYPNKFSHSNREISLMGEAFFDVTPNAAKPFIIKTNNASVMVLGTSFNVCAYKNSPTVEVVVKTGKVELAGNSQPNIPDIKKILLLPGEKGVFNSLSQSISKNMVQNNNSLSWLTHEIEFKYTPLNDVVETINKAFNLQVNIDHNVDPNLQINATFNNQKPEYILEVVTLTLNLKLEKNNNTNYTIKAAK